MAMSVLIFTNAFARMAGLSSWFLEIGPRVNSWGRWDPEGSKGRVPIRRQEIARFDTANLCWSRCG